MSRQIQIRRGTAVEHANFTGAEGEVTYDTTAKTLRVHDGTTAGGTVLAKQSEIPEQYTMPDNYDFVVESQLPTAENSYTWYRKYKSGWIEQGALRLNVSGTVSIVFPKEMANNRYTILKTLSTNSGNEHISYNQISFYALTTTGATTTTAGAEFSWVVYGMAA